MTGVIAASSSSTDAHATPNLRVADAVGQPQQTVVDDGAAGVHDVGYVPVLLAVAYPEQGCVEFAEDSSRLLKVEQDRADRVGARRPDAVGED
jgi:hypothetical protein